MLGGVCDNLAGAETPYEPKYGIGGDAQNVGESEPKERRLGWAAAGLDFMEVEVNLES